ncbi:urease accessory protein UreE [Alkalilimnicola ehrlichii MLHE-1]|uniref:Urease accessory protein UreE n=1 Tax=Alkalilimnicola ehrlichii (strain ATCC BAA-1101 / DSM 17681 / MLHE-1) TaxID=187272 RepID=UREE_ALKEH|nr:urease accessory protein UreE [Alkalilimnicola ehrlichii]Q0AC97.1 RecName: Full=Urease accessory protein UreE [Alkalilimnicola ehrlichii MLHE-1]ABI55540.1 UreE urease accessory domain protein [Alkalilimnicola ehrlichii MLHE-1]
MLTLTERLPQAAPADATLTLPFEVRQKSRFRATLDDGREVGVMLSRGEILRDGQCLQAGDGTVVRVHAAAEAVSTVRGDDGLALARACYHLGNRHVPLQIGAGFARYLHDHVLDDMLRGLGLEVVSEQAPFEPEPGAYGGGHGHTHSHDHSHQHDPAGHAHEH